MHKIEGFGETRSAAITVLIDNRADLIVKSTDAVRYFTEAPLLAEHGFAALIELGGAGIRILLDGGGTPMALVENMNRMDIDPATIDKIALSHGHWDHTAGVTEVLRRVDIRPKAREWPRGATVEEILNSVERRRVPVIAHPAAFRERWWLKKDGTRHGPVPPPPREEWEALGGEVVLSDGPFQLGSGCWVTGSVPRLSFEESGRPSALAYREGNQFIRDEVDEDQAIVINVKGKGLIIISGCAHSGIVNTVNYGREISGVDRIWAILGGFHLASAPDEEIQQTIDAIKRCKPVMVVPSHCTGLKAACQFAAQMAEQFVVGVVGATYMF
jgi:7,8-dihydropterin-6-yl-methyl-4-(beta-D-ribofuranosyl)aminobenzene 5'-phosphate synthase